MCCGYNKLPWNQLGFCSRFTIFLFWWLIPLGPVAGLLNLCFALIYAVMVVGIPVFPRLAIAGLYAIHPFGRNVVSDPVSRPKRWIQIAWALSIVLFGVWLLAYWLLCLPIIAIMAIFYTPYLGRWWNILQILVNPINSKVVREGDESNQRDATVPVVVTPQPQSHPQPIIVASAPPLIYQQAPMAISHPQAVYLINAEQAQQMYALQQTPTHL